VRTDASNCQGHAQAIWGLDQPQQGRLANQHSAERGFFIIRDKKPNWLECLCVARLEGKTITAAHEPVDPVEHARAHVFASRSSDTIRCNAQSERPNRV
jgi:hypothetical protein